MTDYVFKNRLAIAAIILSCCIPVQSNADVIGFDELPLAADSFFDGYGADATGDPWFSKSAEFNTGMFTGGWSYSNVDDTTTAGAANQWAAFTGSDFSGSGNYALANSFVPNSAFINLPENMDLQSVQITNSTYAAISMRDGDSFAKKFGGDSGDDPDFFKLTINGFDGLDASGNLLGSVEFYLADYRFADNNLDYIVRRSGNERAQIDN